MFDTAPEPRAVGLASEADLRRAAATYGGELRRYAARHVGNRSVAEDLVQETWLRAWRAADRFDATRGTLRAWLFAILRNVIVDFGRMQSSRPLTSPVLPEVSSADDADAVIGAIALADALRQLTEQQREVIFHGHVRERPHDEIAALLGVPVGTVRSRLFYARKALRRALADVA